MFKWLFIPFIMIAIFSTFVESKESLKVCTTGDYPPLTYFNKKTHKFNGFAITVIENFAKSENKKIQFVPTTWANLTTDLKNNCDFAVGGVTNTAKRAEQFMLSPPLKRNQKSPVFSKYNAKTFTSFNKIDQASTTVIENKGGTNESFAKSHIQHANIIVVPSNEAAYACLNKYPRKKLVMFTDQIEIDYRTHQSKSKLSSSGKNIYIPNNPVSQKVFMTNKNQKGKELMSKFKYYYDKNSVHFKHWFIQAIGQKYPHQKAECPF
ncbi:hypothetical protein CF386_09825 [Paraphotobacterium marinum]|uniref:Solute-binding protein family 3/N-terminal domain-containing protein n=1 Tax=Paraphotobacterium marinum TaxID=1755811 RepID=A0A220VGC5_9GAMM|nr:transporter substrate-binding domain-containing protein [Paraphotobacterium marinum]ASK79351.1 hypothetical protein CF386_09825 [Paraphotobacterium marinum]